jgi:hypothetical protein
MCCGSLTAKEDAVSNALGCSSNSHSAAQSCTILYTNYPQCSEKFAAFYHCYNAAPSASFTCVQGQGPVLNLFQHCMDESNAFLTCQDG